MKEYRYILEPYTGMKTRYRCPSCKKSKTFVRYIDKETNEYLDENFGKCERVNKCGYHKPPDKTPVETKYLFVSFDKIEEHKMAYRLKIGEKIYYLPQKIVIELTANNCYVPEWFLIDSKNIIPHNSNDFKYYLNGSPVINAINIIQKEAPKPISYIDVEIFKASLKRHEANNFVEFLINLFGADITNHLIKQYFIGTSKHWNGATVFWQIDTHGKVRTGKIMLYNPTTGKRIKEPYKHVNWVHKVLRLTDFQLRQCLFGEHLLIDKTKPVTIVESEKTAIIASIYFPQFIWVAVGSLQNLNAEKCSILKGRTVFLFPDLNGFEKWSSKAKELSHLANFIVSDLLERKATDAEKKDGFDLADYLIKYDYKAFALPETEATEPPEPQT
jgi:hypothetical protein